MTYTNIVNRAEEPGQTRSANFLRLWPTIVSICSLFIGGWVLLGWNFDVPILQIWIFAEAKTTATTAFALVLSGVSLWLLQRRSPAGAVRHAGRLCALTVALIGLVTLSEYIFATDFGIDNLLYRGAIATSLPDSLRRIPFPNAINLALIGIALLLLTGENPRSKWLSQILASIAVLTPALTLAGYVHNIPALYTFGAATEMPWLAAVMMILLSCGIIIARPDGKLMRMLAVTRAGPSRARF